ncbi:MAG: glycosyltransferase [Candidatus Hermodarchaeota archaeon]
MGKKNINKMKILFVGAFNNPWSTHHPMVSAFRRNKHKVVKFDFRYLALKNIKLKFQLYSEKFKLYFETFIMYRLYLPDKIRNIKFYFFGNWLMNRQLLKIVKKNKFDLVFIAKGDTVNYNLIPIINKFSKTWYYFMDPLNVSHEIRAHKYALLSTWSSASTRSMNLLFKKKGANNFYITQGYNNNVFNPVNNKIKSQDVVFVGTKTPEREKIVKYLRENGINIQCYGVGWENKPIYLYELVKKYHTTKIILNFPREDSGFSVRVFQVMGTASFLLSGYCLDFENFFKKGVHLDWFKTPEECLNLIKYYLKNGEIREQIAKEGNSYISKKYTWDKIIKNILDIIENESI